MDGEWRPLEVFLPANLSPDEVRNELHARAVAAAAEGGEFVGRLRAGPGEDHSEEWVRWPVAYLPGPPSVGGIDVMDAVELA